MILRRCTVPTHRYFFTFHKKNLRPFGFPFINGWTTKISAIKLDSLPKNRLYHENNQLVFNSSIQLFVVYICFVECNVTLSQRISKCDSSILLYSYYLAV